MSLVSSIHQGLGDLCVVRTFLKKEEGRTELGREREREETEKRQRERKTRESETGCMSVCVVLQHHTTQNYT